MKTITAWFARRPLHEKAYFWGFVVGFAAAMVTERGCRNR